MSPDELAVIVAWVQERHGETAWDNTAPAVWGRVPADAVWKVLVTAGDHLPTPGEVRQLTVESQTPSSTKWSEWSKQLGFGGPEFSKAVAVQHRKALPGWSPFCRCFSKSAQFAAAEHVACHQAGCDIHAAEIEAFRKAEKEKAEEVAVG